MSQENVEVIEIGMAAFNRGDWDAALAVLAEDVVWVPFLAAVENEGSLYGHAAIRQTWEAQREVFGGDAFGVEASGIRDLGGGTVLTPVRISGRGATSGAEIAAEYALLWTLRGGLVVRVDSYANEADALQAVGLSE